MSTHWVGRCPAVVAENTVWLSGHCVAGSERAKAEGRGYLIGLRFGEEVAEWWRKRGRNGQ